MSSMPKNQNVDDEATLEFMLSKLKMHNCKALSSTPNGGDQAAFCEDIIEQQIGYCVARETEANNVVEEAYWIKYTELPIRNMTKARDFKITTAQWKSIGKNFGALRQKAIFYASYLQHRLDHHGETMLIAVAIFDNFYQRIFREQLYEDLNQFTSEEFQYLVASVAILVASKYDEIYPAPVADFTYLLSTKKTNEYPHGVQCDTDTLHTVERRMLVAISRNGKAPSRCHLHQQFYLPHRA